LRIGHFDGKRDLADILPSWTLNFAVAGFAGDETYGDDEDTLHIPFFVKRSRYQGSTGQPFTRSGEVFVLE
jgi:hypothetical protein